jgi:hypothetical protein
MYPANRGKAHANAHLRNEFPAIADAATGRYATTRYVSVELKEKEIDVPKGIDPIIGTIQ